MTAAILIYHGKHGDQYWLADTTPRMEAALRALFKQIDEQGCYNSNDNPDVACWLIPARGGDIRYIRTILEIRRDYEYEGWNIEYAEIPA